MSAIGARSPEAIIRIYNLQLSCRVWPLARRCWHRMWHKAHLRYITSPQFIDEHGSVTRSYARLRWSATCASWSMDTLCSAP